MLTSYVDQKPAGPLKIVLQVNGSEVTSGVVPGSALLLFTANDCLDIADLGSPVSPPARLRGLLAIAFLQVKGKKVL